MVAALAEESLSSARLSQSSSVFEASQISVAAVLMVVLVSLQSVLLETCLV